MGTGSAYATFFEDNHIAALLDNAGDAFQALASALDSSTSDCSRRLRELAYATYRRRFEQKKFPRLPVYRAYQAAGLVLLSRSGSPVAQNARTVQRERFPGCAHQPGSRPPTAFPHPEDIINTRTFFTELRRRPGLREVLWPERDQASFLEGFRERERRRELLAAAARLGHGFIDLWVLMVKRIGSMALGAQERSEERAEALIADYLNLLESQSQQPGFHAYRELAEIGQHYDLILAVNFPEDS